MDEKPQSQCENAPDPETAPRVETLPPDILQLISRYRGYGWNWPIIAQLVSRELGTTISTAEIKRLCGKK